MAMSSAFAVDYIQTATGFVGKIIESKNMATRLLDSCGC